MEQWTIEFSPLQGIDEPCRTLFIQRIRGALYALCIFPSDDATEHTLKLYEIQLNMSALQESTVQLENYATITGREFTNVVYANQGNRNSDLHFFVVVDGIVYRITPSEHRRKSSTIPLTFEECVNVTCINVQYIKQNDVLLAHCRCCSADQSCTVYGVYYHIDDEQVTKSEGLPFICPDRPGNVVFINVTSNTIEVQGEQYELEGDGFRGGLCSGDSSAAWFAYQDNSGNIFSTSISSTLTFDMVAENGCLLGPMCTPISNISSLLLLQEFDNTGQQIIARAIKPNANNSVLFEIHSSQPNFFAFIDIPSRSLPSPTPSPSTTQPVTNPLTSTSLPSLMPSPPSTTQSVTTSTLAPSQRPTKITGTLIVVIVASAIAAVVVIVGAIIIFLICLYKCQQKRYLYM